MSKKTPIASECCEHESETGSSTTHPSSAMCERSTGCPTVAAWIASLPVSPASRSASPGSEREATTSGTCGLTPFALFERSSPDSPYWRTSQGSLLPGISEPSSVTWPPRGSMRSGIAYPRRTSERRTEESGCGLWPTPRAHESGDYQRDRGVKGKERPTLTGAVKLWPTPCATDFKGANPLSRPLCDDDLPTRVKRWPTPRAYSFDKSHTPGLTLLDIRVRGLYRDKARYWPTPTNSMVTMADMEQARFAGNSGNRPSYAEARDKWPTPTSSDGTGGPGSSGRDGGENLRTAVGGTLNPMWVEALMGWPRGWTDLAPLDESEFLAWMVANSESEDGAKEELQALWIAVFAEELQRATGRPGAVQAAEILQPTMREQSSSTEALEHVSLAGEEASKDRMRSVRVQIEVTGSPHRSGASEQRPEQSSDALQVVSRLLARYGQAAWQTGSWEDALPRVATGVSNRVDRLRALGNGQVAAVVAEAWKRLTEAA